MKLNQQMIDYLTRLQPKKLSKLALVSISLGTIGFLNVLSQSATANDYIGNKGIQFQENTTIEFEFIQSHGAYQSTFGIIDLDSCQNGVGGEIIFESCAKTPLLAETKPSDIYETVSRRSTYEDNLSGSNYDFVGTPGNAVPQPMVEFTFKTGKRYAFYLESYYEGKFAGVVYSVDFFNNQSNRQALFNEEIPTKLATRRNIPNSEINQFESLVEGGLLLRFDDTGSTLVKDGYQDVDFDDFVVGIGGYENCIYPESQSLNQE
ncbi:conserved hypothetical protein [Hyella patelloides LEGE 07179]|uniref:Uncharacterized protein n=1 Tax=Hyella patelloides LEGE 07179 TaxID=945734 RepID=A0A563VLN7_9CYAN|nr:hypothetical protein [Hyella patelloides]VEP12225.1 conserved hypothetical protein [Hyella patelloides LEGE 07179]